MNESFETELDLENPGKPVYEDDIEDAEVVEDSDDVELEVVDDTPPEDRDRAPLPEDVKQKLDEEDTAAEEYSDKVKQRIAQMKKAWHDERRAKEAAVREREEAVRIAQMAYQERQQYMQYLEENETWALEQARERAKVELERAKSNYRAAYEAGDTDQVVEAQYALQVATMNMDKLANFQPPKRHVQQPMPQQPLQSQQNDVYREQAKPQLDPRVVDWSKKNTWFGKDDEMTNFALGVHQRLVKEGVSPETDEYYERLDARIRQVFPDKVPGTAKKRQSPTVVAPVGRSPKGKKVVLTKTQVALAQKLGITPEQYAKEVMKLEGGV